MIEKGKVDVQKLDQEFQTKLTTKLIPLLEVIKTTTQDLSVTQQQEIAEIITLLKAKGLQPS